MAKKASAHRMLDVLMYVVKNPSCTQSDVLASVYKDVKDRNYGRQSPASAAIAVLRKRGLIEDNCERCPHCGRAARGRRHVELTATAEGKKLAKKQLAKA